MIQGFRTPLHIFLRSVLTEAVWKCGKAGALLSEVTVRLSRQCRKGGDSVLCVAICTGWQVQQPQNQTVTAIVKYQSSLNLLVRNQFFKCLHCC